MERLIFIKTFLTTSNWILAGNFNMILSLESKTGGRKWLEEDCGKFKKLIDQLKLVDIENNNGTFAWFDWRSGNQHIACHLNCFLVAEDLMEEPPYMESVILSKAGSDHWPIAFNIETWATPKYKHFRFEKFWLSHKDFHQPAKPWWAQAEIDHGTSMYKFQQRLKKFKNSLKLWNNNTFGNIFQSMQAIESKLMEIQKTFISGTQTLELMKEEEEIQVQLEERKRQEEILWRQNSRVQWLKEGGNNTKFFPREMVHRQHINRITHMEDG